MIIDIEHNLYLVNHIVIVQVSHVCKRLSMFFKFTWREDVGVEADVERRVADGADCLAGIEDDLPAFGICEYINVMK